MIFSFSFSIIFWGDKIISFTHNDCLFKLLVAAKSKDEQAFSYCAEEVMNWEKKKKRKES